jgi:hypothetical protein
LAAEDLLKVADNIRIVDRGDYVVPRLQVINGLVKLENIHRPGKVLEVDMKVPGHDASFPWSLYSDSNSPVFRSNRTTKSMPLQAIIDVYDIHLLCLIKKFLLTVRHKKSFNTV